MHLYCFTKDKISYICKHMRKIVLHIIVFLMTLGSVCAQGQSNVAQGIFDIKLLKSISVGDYNGVNPILVCDLDGDGLPEMATVQNDYRDNEGRIVVVKGGAFGKQKVIGFGAKYGTPGASFGYSALFY